MPRWTTPDSTSLPRHNRPQQAIACWTLLGSLMAVSKCVYGVGRFVSSDYQMDMRAHRTLMTRIEQIDADLFGFYPLAGIAERMERLEPSLLCFLETQSGEG
jgi:hypothetical protein